MLFERRGGRGSVFHGDALGYLQVEAARFQTALPDDLVYDPAEVAGSKLLRREVDANDLGRIGRVPLPPLSCFVVGLSEDPLPYRNYQPRLLC